MTVPLYFSFFSFLKVFDLTEEDVVKLMQQSGTIQTLGQNCSVDFFP